MRIPSRLILALVSLATLLPAARGQGARNIEGATWLLLFPSLFLTSTLFALNFIGDGLRDALDPRLRT